MIILEANELARFLTYHTNNGFAVVSACRKEYTPEQNKQRTKELENLIKQEGFVFKSVDGGFIEDKGKPTEKEVIEKSFIIYNSNHKNDKANLLKFALSVCRKYGQDSILYSEKGDKPRYYTKNGHVDSTFNNKFIVNDKSQEYFSEFGKNKRFTLDWEPNDAKTNDMKKKAKKAIYGSIKTESCFNY